MMVYRARVTRVDSSGAYVEIPSISPGYEYGPCEMMTTANLSPDDVVAVTHFGNVPDDVVIIGRLLTEPLPPDTGEFESLQVNGNIELPSQGSSVRVGGVVSSASFAAQRIAGNLTYAARVTGDTQNRLQITSDGTVGFGSGSDQPDTHLYRGGVDQLATNDEFKSYRGATTNAAFTSAVNGESQVRHVVRADGKHEWGDGVNPLDTNLYRSGTNTLRTDDSLSVGGNTVVSGNATVSGNVEANRFVVGGSASSASVAVRRPNGSDLAFSARTDSDVDANRIQISSEGRISFGDGSTIDTNLYRGAANMLQTDDNLRVQGEIQSVRTSSTSTAMTATASGDGVNRFLLRADGQMSWGDGTNSRDTNLYRSADNTLRTDDNFHVQGSLTVNGGVNVPSNRPLPGTCVARLRRTSSSTVALENPIPWDAEDWDTLGAHASGSASYVPNVAGKYRVTAIVTTQPIGSGSALIARVRKNGSVQSTVTATSNSSPSAGNGWMISDVVQCNGTSDSIDVTVSNNAGTAVNAAGSVLTITYEGP